MGSRQINRRWSNNHKIKNVIGYPVTFFYFKYWNDIPLLIKNPNKDYHGYKK